MNHSADATCIRWKTLRGFPPYADIPTAAVGWKTTAGLFHASGRDT